jgi:geranylgeranyl diphosphate synthase type II
MKILAQYSAILEEALQHTKFPEEPHNLYDPLRYFLQLGGKRMRPMLTLMACKLVGSPLEKALPAALAVEYFHNFSLIHDDIMDAAPLRRGQATVHEKWNAHIAILSGDVLLVKAYDHLASYDAETFKNLYSIFNKTAVEVCEGQQMDMDFEQRTEVNEADYLEMIRLKTSVLLGCALQMGGIVGGAQAKDSQHLYDFGEQLGLAFQIQDDILDLYGESAQVGKQIGGDVLANKKTLLSIIAKRNADTTQLEELMNMERTTNPELKVARAQELYTKLGARSYCEVKMHFHHQKALEALQSMSAHNTSSELLELSEFLLTRSF